MFEVFLEFLIYAAIGALIVAAFIFSNMRLQTLIALLLIVYPFICILIAVYIRDIKNKRK